MKKMRDQIKNYIRLHTSDIDDSDYIALLRGIAEWANSEADATEYRLEEGADIPAEE